MAEVGSVWVNQLQSHQPFDIETLYSPEHSRGYETEDLDGSPTYIPNVDRQTVFFAELESCMEESSIEFPTSIEFFASKVIQLALVSMFAVACPAGPAVAIVLNTYQIRATIKYAILYNKRTTGMGTASMGVWDNIITIIAFAAVANNMAILFFTSEHFQKGVLEELLGIDRDWRQWFFIVTEHIILTLQAIYVMSVASAPKWVHSRLSRAKGAANRLLRVVKSEKQDDTIQALQNVWKTDETTFGTEIRKRNRWQQARARAAIGSTEPCTDHTEHEPTTDTDEEMDRILGLESDGAAKKWFQESS